MKRKMFLAAMLMMAIGMQTAQAQFMRVWQNGKADTYDVSMVDSVQFVDAKYEWVDLGLPSGTLWATFNVGAFLPEEYGDYFAWGETEPKENYSWATYKYCNGTRTTMTKYCQKSEYGYNGYTDTLTVLQPEDDAATVNWGSGWQTPSDEQFRELLDSRYTNVSPKELNGVKGLEISGKTSHMSIFLPFAGQNAVSFIGQYGYYWTSTLDSSYVTGSIMFTCAENLDWSAFSVYYRYFGLSVRPVVRKQ